MLIDFTSEPATDTKTDGVLVKPREPDRERLEVTLHLKHQGRVNP